jgi:hypothetical protein
MGGSSIRVCRIIIIRDMTSFKSCLYYFDQNFGIFNMEG